MTTTGPRILVTGAAGFLGAAVVRDLAAAGARVRALVRTPAAAADLLSRLDSAGALELVVGSLGENEMEADAVAGCDVVVHAAAALRGSASTLVRQNVIATRRLVRAATQQRVHRFVLVSSLGVYDTSSLRAGDVLDERRPVDRAAEMRTPYIYSKVVQEQVCWESHCVAALPLTVVRPGVIFGPGRSGLTDRVGPRVGRWVAVIGPLRALPYTFVENCARAIALAALTTAPIEGESFNIVDDQLPTGRDIVRCCRRAGTPVRSMPVPLTCAPLLARMFGLVHRWSDGMLPPVFGPQVIDAMYKPLRFSNERAKRRLGWRPVVDLETALDLTFGSGR